MRFDRLEISFLRNLTSVALELGPGLNFFYGANGAGKTAILEAAHVLARGRSFRTQRARTLIQDGAEMLGVRAVVADEHRGSVTLGMTKSLAGRTELRINGVRERRLSDAARLVPLQVLLPDIAGLVFDGPQGRRQWLDWGLFHVEPEYLPRLREYLQALKQRNAVLKQGVRQGVRQGARQGVREGARPGDSQRNDAGGLTEALAPWEASLISAAAAVDELRAAYVAAVAPVFAEVLRQLAPDLTVGMAYLRGWPAGRSLAKLLGESRSREVKLGATQVGPHRADIELSIGNARASAVLSRGQGKMVATALKVSQARHLASSASRRSVFLIDDAGAELDDAHSARFYEMLQHMGSQILATSTQRPVTWDGFTPDRRTLFHVEHGTVHPAAG